MDVPSGAPFDDKLFQEACRTAINLCECGEKIVQAEFLIAYSQRHRDPKKPGDKMGKVGDVELDMCDDRALLIKSQCDLFRDCAANTLILMLKNAIEVDPVPEQDTLTTIGNSLYQPDAFDIAGAVYDHMKHSTDYFLRGDASIHSIVLRAKEIIVERLQEQPQTS